MFNPRTGPIILTSFWSNFLPFLEVEFMLFAGGKKKQRPWDLYLEKRKVKKREIKAAVKARRAEQRAILRGHDDKESSVAGKKRKREGKEDGKEKAEAGGSESLSLLVDEAGGSGRGKNYDLRKLLKGEEKEFQPDVEDPRFAALYDSHLFNIDPSDASFKPTPGMEAIVREKVKRGAGKKRKEQQTTEQTPQSDWADTAAKLKRKAASLQQKKKPKRT